MNSLSTLWQGIVDALNASKLDLGIGNDILPGAERGKTGQVVTLSPPSAAVWIAPQPATTVSQTGAVTIPVDVHVFCVGAPTDTESGAVDNAMEIAIKVLHFLTGIEIAGTVLFQPDNEAAVEIVESSSSQAVVGVLLKAEVVYG